MALENAGDPIANPQQTQKEKRAEQARINGRKSQGPTSQEGRAKSSKNAIRHGLTANEHTLLAAELPGEYTEVRDAFIDDLRPATKSELRLVEKIANLDWRLERLVMMETCVLNMETGINADKIMKRFEHIDGIGFIVEAWKESLTASHCLDLLRRYMGTLQHQFNSTLSNFRNFEKARLARTRGGLNLDSAWEQPYQVPIFESHLPPQALAPAPSELSTPNELAPVKPAPETNSAVANLNNTPQLRRGRTAGPADGRQASSRLPARAQRNEPTQSAPTPELCPRFKRPAA
jgi:hypothetical protein